MKKGMLSTKISYTIKFVVGISLSFLIVLLSYWLAKAVDNFWVTGLIIILVGFPLVSTLLKLPLELIILASVWKAEDPTDIISSAEKMRSGKNN